MSKARLKVAALGPDSFQVIITRLKLEITMRLQLVGNYTIEEFEKAISNIIENFKSNKINSFRHINIYLKTCVDGREIKLTDDGEEVEHLIFDFSERRQISMLSADLSVVTAHKVKQKNSEDE